MAWILEDDTTAISPQSTGQKWILEEPEKESTFKSAARTALQVPKALAQVSTPGLISSGLATGLATTPQQELEEHRERVALYQKMFPNAPLPESAKEENYLKATTPAVQGAQEYLPTVENIARGTENLTGIPLEAKTGLQKGIGLATEAAALRPGGLLQKAAAGVAAPALSQTLQGAGVPEGIADLVAFFGSQAPVPVAFEKGGRFNPIQPEVQIPNVRKQLEHITKPGTDFTSEFNVGENIVESLKNVPRENPPTPNVPAVVEPTPKAPEFEPLPKAPITPEAPKPPKEFGIKPSAQPLQAKPIEGKKVSKAPALGLQIVPISPNKPAAIEDQIGEIVSKERVYNPTQTGEGLKKELSTESEKKYAQTNALYKEYDKLAENISGNLNQQIRADLQTRLDKLKAIDNDVKSAPQKDLQKAIQSILSTGQLMFQGRNLGTEPIPVKLLDDIKKSLSNKVDHDFAHGQPTNIFKPVIGLLEQGINDIISKNPEALAARQAANQSHAEWAQTYNNEYIRPFLDKSNKDYEKLFNSSLKPDELNQLRTALQSPKGQEYINAIVREIVEREIAPYTKQGKINARELDNTLRRLEAVVSPEQAKQIKQALLAPSALRKKKITQPQKEHKTLQEKHAAEVKAMRERHKQEKMTALEKRKPIIAEHKKKVEETKQKNKEAKEREIAERKQYEKDVNDYFERNKDVLELTSKPPEKLVKELETVQGVRRLKKFLSKENFEKVKNWKTADIITRGKIEPSEKAQDIVNLLKDKETLALLNELNGPEFANDLRIVMEKEAQIQESLEQLAKEKPSFENVKNGWDFLHEFLLKPTKLTYKKVKFITNILKKENLKKVADFARTIPKRLPKVKLNKNQLDQFQKHWEKKLGGIFTQAPSSDQDNK